MIYSDNNTIMGWVKEAPPDDVELAKNYLALSRIR